MKLWGRLDNEEALEWKKTWQEEKVISSSSVTKSIIISNPARITSKSRQIRELPLIHTVLYVHSCTCVFFSTLNCPQSHPKSSSHFHPAQALHVQTTAQLREMVVQCGHMEEALKVAREREEACRAREGALKAALERKDVSKTEALRAKDELRAKEEDLKAREEALKAREEAVEAREEALQEREEAAEAKEEALKREEEGLKEAGERADGREGALEKSKQELQEEVLSLTAKVRSCLW